MNVRLVIGIVAMMALAAPAEEKLYRINSKDVGWDSIDLTISEVRRNGPVSVLRIPRYENRTAAESRFAMCAFTDIAIQRDYAVWVVSSAKVVDNLVRVGFLKSESDDAVKLLGKEFGGDDALRTSVEAINRLCGIRKSK